MIWHRTKSSRQLYGWLNNAVGPSFSITAQHSFGGNCSTTQAALSRISSNMPAQASSLAYLESRAEEIIHTR